MIGKASSSERSTSSSSKSTERGRFARRLGVLLGMLAVMCVSSESHIGDAKSFLTVCDEKSPCADAGQVCSCVCTIPCDDDEICKSELADSGIAADRIVCARPACGGESDDGPGEGAVCDVECEVDADCRALSAEHLCTDGFCRAPSLTGDLGLGGSSSVDSSPECPDGGWFHDAPEGAFCLLGTEVTVDEFTACVEDGSCDEPTTGNYFVAGREAHPIQDVTTAQATSYCTFLGGSLPTRAQWQFAASGEAGTAYPWGDAEPAASDVPPRVCALDAFEETCAVQTYPAGDSSLGVSDLSGNVAEIVADGADFCAAGGSYVDTDPALLRADACVAFTDSSATVGFRCVLPSTP